jgi:L-fuconolactonase
MSATMRIDAHHHFWKYDPVEYDWIDNKMSVIRRDFLPQDLRAAMDTADVDGVVSVQARQSLEETRWLLELAQQHDFIRGVVGWVPLVSPRVGEEIERFAANPKLRAARHVLQGEADERYMLGDDFNAGIRELKPHGLAYDILIFERHLPQTIEFVDRHPEQVFVLDHIAKPRIGANVLSPWRENIRELAKRDNVFCKISGMVTEADYRDWTVGQLRPYVQVVLEAFGPRRLMAGSDWPVCLVACGYRRWWEILESFVAELSPDERQAILGGTAVRAYGL